MPGFYPTGSIEPTRHRRSFRVYFIDNGQKIFVGLVARKALELLLENRIFYADICKFDDSATAQEPLTFSVELKP